MQRPIKFRAWDKEGHHSRDGKARMLTIDTHPSSLASIMSDVCLGSEVENVELSQYTGLKDKDGVEIFEGDIVRSGYDEVYQIKYMGDRGYPAFDVVPDIAADCNGLSYLLDGSEDGLEVIGNIYENSELLEDTQ